VGEDWLRVREIGKLHPNARFSEDDDRQILFAYASIEDQLTITSVMDQLAGSSRVAVEGVNLSTVAQRLSNVFTPPRPAPPEDRRGDARETQDERRSRRSEAAERDGDDSR
jgi:hypothetical protein